MSLLKKISCVLFLFFFQFSCVAGPLEEDELPSDNKNPSTQIYKNLSSKKEEQDLRQTPTYIGLLSTKILLQWNLLEPETLLPILFTSRFIPKVIDHFMGDSYLGSFCKGAYRLANFAVLGYYAYTNFEAFILSYGASWLAENIADVIHSTQFVKNKEILGGLLFVLEEAGKRIGHELFVQGESPPEPMVEKMVTGGFQSFILDHHHNGTCPVLSTLSSNGVDVFSSATCSVFSGKLQLPPEYCLAFEKEQINQLSLVMAKKVIEDFSLKEGKKFGIFGGERHGHVSDFLMELGLLRVAHSIGIKHLLLEVPAPYYEELQRQALASSSLLTKTPLLHVIIQAAIQLGMEVVPIDLASRTQGLTVKGTCPTMEVIFDPEREAAICRNILVLKANFIAFLGHLHPSYFSHRCAGMSEEYSLSFFTWHTRESTDKINQALEAFRPCKPYVSDRYKEAISFPNGGEMTQLSLKASKALERNTLGRLLFSGVLKFDERP